MQSNQKMKREMIDQAADILWQNWMRGSRIDALPEQCKPDDRSDAYAIQAAVARHSRRGVSGWKIAATSEAGQRHIGVDGPLAGRLLGERVLRSGDRVTLGNNVMQVAEAEFAFRLGRSLPSRSSRYSTAEVLSAAESLHPAIEIPDSRYNDFAVAGAAQLIADNACACWFVLGPADETGWRSLDLVEHAVRVWRNGKLEAQGKGANVLGDPLAALAWIANEVCAYGAGLQAGDIVTTGTCIVPMQVRANDTIRADFGAVGSVEAVIT